MSRRSPSRAWTSSRESRTALAPPIERPAHGVHVRLTVEAETYAIPVDQVLELAMPADVTLLPGSPPSLIGVWNLRGEILPLLDLSRLLGLTPSRSARRVLVVEVAGQRAGLAVDEVTDVGVLRGRDAARRLRPRLRDGACRRRARRRARSHRALRGARAGEIVVTDRTAEFLQIFRDEAETRLDRMTDALLGLESGTAAADAVDSLFRDAHSIKGGAGMLGLQDVRLLADAVEDVLGQARATDPSRSSSRAPCSGPRTGCAHVGGATGHATT